MFNSSAGQKWSDSSSETEALSRNMQNSSTLSKYAKFKHSLKMCVTKALSQNVQSSSTLLKCV